MAAFGVTYGAIMVAAQLGMAGGGLIAGLLYDLSGSYTSSWILSVVSGLITAFIAMDLKAPSRPTAPAELSLPHESSITAQEPSDTPAAHTDRAPAVLR
jgi:MFS family permease